MLKPDPRTWDDGKRCNECCNGYRCDEGSRPSGGCLLAHAADRSEWHRCRPMYAPRLGDLFGNQPSAKH